MLPPACLPADYQASDIPIVDDGSSSVRVMAGTRNNVTGPIKMRNPGLLMDVRIPAGGSFTQEVRAWGGCDLIGEGVYETWPGNRLSIITQVHHGEWSGTRHAMHVMHDVLMFTGFLFHS